MKKIVTVITLLLAFTISANAQSNKAQIKKSDSKEVVTLSSKAAHKDANAIAEFLGLNDTQREDFARLFKMKHEVMQNADLPVERKKEMSRDVAAKIEASIDGTQLAKLKANTALYNQLISTDN